MSGVFLHMKYAKTKGNEEMFEIRRVQLNQQSTYRGSTVYDILVNELVPCHLGDLNTQYIQVIDFLFFILALKCHIIYLNTFLFQKAF